jgi:predicted nucleic acid-binding protein
MRLEFVDTNVLLYAYDVTAGSRHQVAKELVGRLGRERRGALSVQVLQEFYVNATGKVAVPLAPKVAVERLRTLARWTVHAPLPADVVAAGELSVAHHFSFWDAMILTSAARLDCSVLWTEDLNPGQPVGGVTITNPFT